MPLYNTYLYYNMRKLTIRKLDNLLKREYGISLKDSFCEGSQEG